MQLDVETVARINEINTQLGWVRQWAAGVQTELETLLAGGSIAPPTMTVDEQVAEADSPTRVLKALEREFGKDRRTILGYVERLVKVYQLERKYGADWSKNLQLFKDLAARHSDGRTQLARGIASLD